MLDGQEQIDLNFIENMEQKDFVQKEDFLPLEGEPNSHAVLLSLIHISRRYLKAVGEKAAWPPYITIILG